MEESTTVNNPGGDPRSKGRPKLTDPLSPEEYATVKSRYPNIAFNDEDQSFITSKGKQSYARRLKFFRPLTPEETAMGNEARRENAANVWKKFLDHLGGGARFSDAAKRTGVGYTAARKRYNADPEFRKQCDEAEQRAAEPVEDALFSAATQGNVPAAIKWLEKRAPERWPGDKVQIEQKNIYELDASDRVGNIISLMARLQQRAELSSGDVVDVEAFEPSPGPPEDD